jgi:hypothetical protein
VTAPCKATKSLYLSDLPAISPEHASGAGWQSSLPAPLVLCLSLFPFLLLSPCACSGGPAHCFAPSLSQATLQEVCGPWYAHTLRFVVSDGKRICARYKVPGTWYGSWDLAVLPVGLNPRL